MKDTFCPKCRTHLILADNIENSKRLKCSQCFLEFDNPHYIKPISSFQYQQPIVNIHNNSTASKFVFNPIIFFFIVFVIVAIIGIRHYTSKTTTIDKQSLITLKEPTSTNDDDNNSNIIKMKKEDGVYKVHIYINGVRMEFIFDTGASTISISQTEAHFLIKQGTLTNDDIKGSANFFDANGDISVGRIINLREVKIGNKVLHNVKASVVDNFDAPLLLGQSALKGFGKITIDYENLEIIFIGVCT